METFYHSDGEEENNSINYNRMLKREQTLTKCV